MRLKRIDSFTGRHAFLSNFYASPLTMAGIRYPSAEHAFQSLKTRDETMKLAIADARTASAAKRMGRRLPLPDGWNEQRVTAMRVVLTLKFNPLAEDFELAMWLDHTGNAELIEGNTWGDTYWGVCNGVGFNQLGKLLMEVRQANRQTEE